MTQESDGIIRVDYAALCPRCKQPHHYVEISFPIENDRGYWMIECARCTNEFVIEVNNPMESGGKLGKQIKERYAENFAGEREIVASEVIRHNIDLNQNEWIFHYGATPLYQCEKKSYDLEGLAKSALESNFKDIASAYHTAQNYLMSHGSDHDFSVVRVPFTCQCKELHTATFYMPLWMDPSKGPRSASDFLLADVSGAKLEQTLDGIVSKNDAMDLLEKLIIRWNLLADQILIVAPFLGTQYLSSAKQMEIWQWLLKILDPAKSVFLTRGATWTSYKRAMEAEGISVKLLEEFGLENALSAMDIRKQDFHAKFFAGISATECEVMSGSTNLVRGPSVENIAFQKIEKKRFDERYIDRLKLKIPLPSPKRGAGHWVLIDKGPAGWRSGSEYGTPYLEKSPSKATDEHGPKIGREHPISKGAKAKILANAIDFLNAGLDLLFDDSLSSKTAKLAVVSIQTSIELFAKYRLVKEDGIQAIVRGKFISTNAEVDSKNGTFNTIGFEEALKLINKREATLESDERLIKELVNLRNALVHFSSKVDSTDVKHSCIHILIRVLSMYALGEDRDAGEMTDYKRFLSEKNFHALTNFEPYRCEAVDVAYDDLDNDNVLTCYKCGNESFGLRLSETYFCRCCGFGLVKDAIAFSDCKVCETESGVFYDPLNTNNEMHYGKCMKCDIEHWIWSCEKCNTVVSQLVNKERQTCPECSQP